MRRSSKNLPPATPAFDAFWAVYPRRDARKDARLAWFQGNCELHAADIMAALVWQAPIFAARLREHRPLPATYLRGERWTDEPPQVAAAARDPLRIEFEKWQETYKDDPQSKVTTFEQFRQYVHGRRRTG